ncbi:hypothetical protein KAU11_12485, partial [Candidatus Babeliales bacterium]|nr:hypothetical protein [Candidatus Babeliales bacterium]
MADLFERTGLEQDTGLLKQRWGQDGSTVVNIAGQETGDGTLRTVTAGKTLYLSDISIVNAGGNASFNLRDGNGGPIRFTGSFPATVGVSIQGFF